MAYPGFVYPQTHPGRLAVIGALFGMNPAPPERSSVLELGCGDGGATGKLEQLRRDRCRLRLEYPVELADRAGLAEAAAE